MLMFAHVLLFFSAFGRHLLLLRSSGPWMNVLCTSLEITCPMLLILRAILSRASDFPGDHPEPAAATAVLLDPPLCSAIESCFQPPHSHCGMHGCGNGLVFLDVTAAGSLSGWRNCQAGWQFGGRASCIAVGARNCASRCQTWRKFELVCGMCGTLNLSNLRSSFPKIPLDAINRNVVNVIPSSDWVARIGKLGGTIHHIVCEESSPWHCHFPMNTACNLIQRCGHPLSTMECIFEKDRYLPSSLAAYRERIRYALSKLI